MHLRSNIKPLKLIIFYLSTFVMIMCLFLSCCFIQSINIIGNFMQISVYELASEQGKWGPYSPFAFAALTDLYNMGSKYMHYIYHALKCYKILIEMSLSLKSALRAHEKSKFFILAGPGPQLLDTPLACSWRVIFPHPPPPPFYKLILCYWVYARLINMLLYNLKNKLYKSMDSLSY